MTTLRVKVPGVLNAGVSRPVLTRPYDPKAVFGAALLAWYDPAVGADGATLANVPDQSGSGRTLTTVTGTPVYDADGLAGTAAYRFNGSSNIKTAASGTLAGPLTIMVNGQATGSATQYFCDGPASNNLSVLRSSSSGYGAKRIGSAASMSVGSAGDSLPHSLIAVFNGAASALYLDGVQVAGNDQGSAGLSSAALTLGSNGAGASFLTGTVGDYLLIGQALDAAAVAAATAWLIDRRTP